MAERGALGAVSTVQYCGLAQYLDIATSRCWHFSTLYQWNEKKLLNFIILSISARRVQAQHVTDT
jgi:hypothetical protein